MTPDQRRQMIVQAALPLVAASGSAVTTLQVARAAGIGEATIFRVFPTKDALLDAVVAAVLRPDRALTEIDAIPLHQPLADRLIAAAAALQAHLDRMGTALGALHASGHNRDRRRPPAAAGPRAAAPTATRDAVARLFEPERHALRHPPARLAEVLIGLLLARGRPLGGGEAARLTVPQLVDLLLHGALAEGGDR